LGIKRFWPEKRWKKIVFVILIIMVVLSVIILGFVSLGVSNDVVSDIIVVNDQGTFNALLIYHPGFSSFSKDVVYAYAEGLALNDWRIEITTPSDQAPTSISDYSLLIVAAPVYGFGPTPTISRHIDRIGDLQETRTAVIITAAGNPGNAVETMKEIIEQNNGIVDSQIILFSLAPNEGDQSAIDLSREAGNEIFP
jgi:flavorubredoxin